MDDQAKSNRSRVFTYHGTLPPALALLLVAPLLFLLVSFAAFALIGGGLAALVLPLFVRGRRRRRREPDCITLERDQYTQVEADAPKLPRP